MSKTVYGLITFIFCIEYSDGAELEFECTEEEISKTAERFSNGYGYKIYRLKESKEIFKEKKNNEKV